MFETWCQQGVNIVESPLKSTLLLVNCIHNINSCVRFMGCFTCERCNISSIHKRSTRVVATFKKPFVSVASWSNYIIQHTCDVIQHTCDVTSSSIRVTSSWTNERVFLSFATLIDLNIWPQASDSSLHQSGRCQKPRCCWSFHLNLHFLWPELKNQLQL